MRVHYAELKQVRADLTAPSAQFEVVTVEAGGHMVRTYRHAPPTLRAFWLSTAAFGDREYLVYEDDRYTYREAHVLSASIANWLHTKGIKSGDRVAIAMRNYPEWLLIYWACVSIGIAVVGLNAWWVVEELEYALKDSAPKAIFADAERLGQLASKPGMTDGIHVVAVRTEPMHRGVIAWRDVISAQSTMPDATIDPNDDACTFYTSGTTGRPKGAQLTHRSCTTHILSMLYAALSQSTALARATGVAPPPPAPPVALIATPFFHVTATNCGAHAATAMGGKLVTMYKWEPAHALHLIERERVTSLSTVPTMAREMLLHPNFAEHDTSSVVSLGGGGAALQPDLVEKIEVRGKGARAATGYGLTETSGIITSVSGDFFVAKPESCGVIMPCFEAKCVGEDGKDVARGSIGELWVKSAQIVKGYLNKPEATAEAITDGWFHTGDVAWIDEDDFVFLVDRKKDMVLRGGENVYCAEVEAALYQPPAVAECCVMGVADERLGEEVGAVIVLRDGFEASAHDLRAEAAKHVARHKLPRYYWISREPLPRNATGKFIKRQLRDSLKPADAVQV
ncbi:MAG: class I adenylate-forming enzyme family protein [Caulobacterales bacterium]